MHAIGVVEYGGPEALRVVELPDREPGAGEVRVRVRAAAVNPVDVLLRSGALAGWYKGLTPPFVPGMDAAGVIDAIGPDLDPALGLQLGQRVVAVINSKGATGAYGEQVIAPAASVVAAPDALDDAHAASFLMNALAAHNALDTAALPAGSTVLVTGAAGAFGTYAVVLAHRAGHRVIALASPADETAVRDVGADVFVARGDDAAARILQAAPDGVDTILDGALIGQEIIQAVRNGGSIIDLRGRDGELERGIRMTHSNVRDRMQDHAAITCLRDLVNDGTLPTAVEGVFAWPDAAAAHARLAEGGLRGRLILDFTTTPG